MRQRYLVKIVLFAALSAMPALAGEYAVLANGFRIYADRHEKIESVVRLHTTSGTVDVPESQVTAFEVEEYVAPAAPPIPAASIETPKPVEVLTPKQILQRAAEKHGLPLSLVESVARAESGFRVDAVSPKGAVGLMQLMPATAAELKADPFDPNQNAEAGTRYLRDLLVKYMDHPYQVEMALAAYNAGPGAVDKYRGIPPYRETQNYVRRVIETKRRLEH